MNRKTILPVLAVLCFLAGGGCLLCVTAAGSFGIPDGADLFSYIFLALAAVFCAAIYLISRHSVTAPGEPLPVLLFQSDMLLIAAAVLAVSAAQFAGFFGSFAELVRGDPQVRSMIWIPVNFLTSVFGLLCGVLCLAAAFSPRKPAGAAAVAVAYWAFFQLISGFSMTVPLPDTGLYAARVLALASLSFALCKQRTAAKTAAAKDYAAMRASFLCAAAFFFCDLLLISTYRQNPYLKPMLFQYICAAAFGTYSLYYSLVLPGRYAAACLAEQKAFVSPYEETGSEEPSRGPLDSAGEEDGTRSAAGLPDTDAAPAQNEAASENEPEQEEPGK